MLKHIFLISLFLPLNLKASEPAHEAPAGAKKVEPEYSGNQSDEWQSVQKDLLILKGKKEKNLQALMDLQAKLKRRKEGYVTQQEQKEIKLLKNKIIEDDNELKILEQKYLLRFPEKGLSKGRLYQRNKNTDSIVEDNYSNDQDDQNIDIKIRKLNKKITHTYNPNGLKKESDKSLKHKDFAIHPNAEPNTTLRSTNESSATAKPEVTEKIKLEK